MSLLSDYLGAIGNSAADLVLSFFGGIVPSTAEREGTARRVRREDKRKAAVEALYANTPALPQTRQCRRRIAREIAKIEAHNRNGKAKAGQPRWNWRDILREAQRATS